MKFGKIFGQTLATLVLCCLGFTSFASADQKAYHAARCEFTSGSGHRSHAGITPGDSSFANIICPLVRDAVGATTDVSQVVLEGYNNSTVESVVCSLTSQDEDSAGAGAIIDFDTQSSNSAGFVQLVFDVDASAGNEGSYSVSCDLKAYDWVYHIHVDEAATD